MKHNYILSFIISLFLTLPGMLSAQNVDLATARQVGAYYLTQASATKQIYQADDLKLVQQIDNPMLCVPALYVFNAPQGFVVVSGSECVDPVLAYSETGCIDSVENPACQAMLESYARHVARNQNAQIAPIDKVRQQWDAVYQHTLTIDNSKAASLMKSKWGQGSRRHPSYNIMCPMDGNYHCITGCVATAMASVIHYWKYPVVGGTENNKTAVTQWNNQMYRYRFRVDSNKFVYDSMPNQIDEESDYAYKHAIGKLMYAVGVTVKMNWGLTASSATTSDCVEALWRYFCYSQEVTYQVRGEGAEQDSIWNAILHNEIVDNGRPVLYRATAPNSTGKDANHCFVICGVSGDYNRYYINWGWDGGSNGFYTITPASSIGTVSGGDTYTDGHAMIHHIYPDTASTVSIIDNTEYTPTPAYPNPASSYINIPSNLDFNAILTVYNAAGSLVDKAVIPAFAGDYRLDIAAYPAGTYLYRLNGRAYKFTVIK